MVHFLNIDFRRYFYVKIPPKSGNNCKSDDLPYDPFLKYADKSLNARWYCSAQFDLYFPEHTDDPHIVYNSQRTSLKLTLLTNYLAIRNIWICEVFIAHILKGNKYQSRMVNIGFVLIIEFFNFRCLPCMNSFHVSRTICCWVNPAITNIIYR